MKLRHKFGVLALIYVLSLSANLVMSGWCIVVYFKSAFVEVQSSFVRQTEIERLRMQIQTVRRQAERGGENGELRLRAERIRSLLLAAASLRPDGARKGANRGDESALWSRLESALASAQATRRADALDRCDNLLGRISERITASRRNSIEQADQTQQKVVTILIANAVLGAILCLVGLVLVRRWVLLPVAGLRTATHEISQGNFEYRIEARSADELGRLAGEVNQMSATIVEMQQKLIEQERQAAAGEMFRRIAHNIRNPLAGIRGLAEATGRVHTPVDEIREYQQRIIKSIDGLEQWLRDLQRSVAPMDIDPQRTDLVELIDNVRNVLVPMADRKGVHIVVAVDPATRYVIVDGFHFEQALVALITNAVQASDIGQTVRVHVAPVPEAADQWCVSVEDDGEGIAPELRAKVFLPDFTTRPDGNGIGLAMAAKVVHTHGGRINLESAPGAGSRFDAIMPGRAPRER